MTAPIIDAFKHEHLGGKRLRLVIVGVVTMFTVPIIDFVSDIVAIVSFLGTHVGWWFVILLLALLLL